MLFSFPVDMGSKALQGRDRVWDLETIRRMLASLTKRCQKNLAIHTFYLLHGAAGAWDS